jgi:hypothetical protein
MEAPTRQPLAEVFGFTVDDFSEQAQRYRKYKLCPFNNREPNCTKDKANAPLGVCSIFHQTSRGAEAVITCPIRFRQEWIIAQDAATFFFGESVSWTSLSEVQLKDRHGQSAGNIDLALVAYDDQGKIIDFGSLEVQAVYISGNVRNAFEHYNEASRHILEPFGHRSYRSGFRKISDSQCGLCAKTESVSLCRWKELVGSSRSSMAN